MKSVNVRILNSLTQQKEALVPKKAPWVTWYTCGPTVYDDAHLGHARTYVAVDMMHRILQSHFQIPVFHAMGVTNIDDKIIAKAQNSSTSARLIAERYEREFLDDMRALNVAPPLSYLRVTDHVREIVDFVQKLVNSKLAYVTSSGVYFDTQQYGKYGGKLSSQAESARDASVSDSGEPIVSDKKSVRDFALWKLRSPMEGSQQPSSNLSENKSHLDDASPIYPSPWGAGRPGWHIECSAMTHSLFGEHLDVHAGGVDLKFPHHENEIAQSEAHLQALSCGSDSCGHHAHANPESWCSYFVHTGHLYIEGRKMSKSLKNFITIKEMLKQHDADAFRMLCSLHRYENNMNYDSATSMAEAQRYLDLFRSFMAESQERADFYERNLSSLVLRPTHEPSLAKSRQARALLNEFGEVRIRVSDALADNFNVPSVIHELRDLADAAKHFWTTCPTQHLHLVQGISQYMQDTLRNSLGFASIVGGVKEGTAEAYTPSTTSMHTAVDVLVDFRSSLRKVAKTSLSEKKKDNPTQSIAFEKKVLEMCDQLRDGKAKDALQVTIRDNKDDSSTWTANNNVRQ